MTTQIMTNILVTSLFAMFLGALNSLLSYFLDYCFWEGSIFERYIPWLAAKNLKIFKPARLKSLEPMKGNKEYTNTLILQAQNMFFFKVLGGCAICSNIWLGFFTFTVMALYTGLSFWLLFPYLLFSSFFLRKIMG